MIQLYNEDCLAAMKKMDSNMIDLVVTSPPYDDLRSYEGFSFHPSQTIEELYRIVKTGGVVVWVVKDQTINGSETLSSFRQALQFVNVGFSLHDTMIFLKDNPVPVGGNNRYYDAFEYMFVFSKGSPKTFNPIMRMRRNQTGDKRTERYKPVQREKNGNFKKKKVTINSIVKKNNVWNYLIGGGNSAQDKIAHKHPAIFPEQLVEDHILSWSQEGDLVLDPFMGSGTSGKMALLTNRNFIGIEISKKYFDIAKERIEEHKKQLRLF